jgi:alpha,alpha-trehalase
MKYLILLNFFFKPAVWAACSGDLNGLLESKLEKIYGKLASRKENTAYPDIPSANELALSKDKPQDIHMEKTLSPGLISGILEEVRKIGGVFDDYKSLSDVKPRTLSLEEIERIEKTAHYKARAEGLKEDSTEYQRAVLRTIVEKSFEFSKDLVKVKKDILRPRWKVKISDPRLKADNTSAFDYVESHWQKLARRTPVSSKGSILPLPYEFLVANETRFDELYYWDSFFGIKGLLVTERWEMAAKTVENFLFEIRRFGMIPNANRDYYLSRSQPPFISSMVREVFDSTDAPLKQKWLRERAYPLMKHDLEDFWMDSKGRFDGKTGLHHHYDDINYPRPERHSSDKEIASNADDPYGLGLTYRDTRAVAESGLDFTDALGKEAANTANVLLNSMIYKYMKDMEYFARLLGEYDDEKYFRDLAMKKKAAMNRYLWDETAKTFKNYNLRSNGSIDGLYAEIFTTMYVGVASKKQARALVEKLSLLEREGGVMSSLFTNSHHQWDGYNGWAPLHFFIIEGLRKYGYNAEAERIATKLANSYAQIHRQHGVFLERIDVRAGTKPEDDGLKYPVQEGFLWTNSIYSWILVDVLKQSITEVQ